MNRILTLACLFLVSYSLLAQNFNRPVPTGFPQYEFVKYDSTFDYNYSSTPISLNNFNTTSRYLSILDEDGYLLWYSPTAIGSFADFKYHPQHQLYSFIQRRNPQSGVFKIMDTSFQVVDSIELVNGVIIDSHEFLLLDNGNMILSGRKDSIVDLSNDTINGVPGSDSTTLIGFVIQKFDSSKNLVFEWNSNDHVNPLEAYYSNYGYNPNSFDYCHGNAIEKDADGNYLISFRHTNSIYKVDGVSGQVIWKLGGKDSYFTFTNDVGFSGQHDIRIHANGNFSLFDNANTTGGNQSRAVEYILDTTNWTANKVWEYKYNPVFFARAMGSYQKEAKFRLINYGLNFRPHPSVVTVDSSGQTLSEFYYQDSTVTYRTFAFKPIDTINRVKVNCSNQNGLITLTAVGGNSFIWNTGANTASITITSPGIYQVWSNKGFGMLGSNPILIDSLNGFCLSNSINEIKSASRKQKRIEGVYDLAGRRVNTPKNNRIYIIRYQGGKAEKVMWNSNVNY